MNKRWSLKVKIKIYMSDPQDLKQIQTWTSSLVLSWLEERYCTGHNTCLRRLGVLLTCQKCLWVREICCFVSFRQLHVHRTTSKNSVVWLAPCTFNTINPDSQQGITLITFKVSAFCIVQPWLQWDYVICVCFQAAPGYYMAKLIIKLFNSIARGA